MAPKPAFSRRFKEFLGVIAVVAMSVASGLFLSGRWPDFFPSPAAGSGFSLTVLVALGAVDYIRQLAKSRALQAGELDPYSFRVFRMLVYFLAGVLVGWSGLLAFRALAASPRNLGLALLHGGTAVVFLGVLVSAVLRRLRLVETEKAIGRLVVALRRIERPNPFHRPNDLSEQQVFEGLLGAIRHSLEQLKRSLDRLSWNLVHHWQRVSGSGFDRVVSIWEPVDGDDGTSRFECVFRYPDEDHEHPLNGMLERYHPVELQQDQYNEFFKRWEKRKDNSGWEEIPDAVRSEFLEEKNEITSLAGALWYCFHRGPKTAFVQKLDKYLKSQPVEHSNNSRRQSRYVYVPNVDALGIEDLFFDHHHIKFIPSPCRLRSVYMRILASGSKKLAILMILDSAPAPLSSRTEFALIEAYAAGLEILLARRDHLRSNTSRSKL